MSVDDRINENWLEHKSYNCSLLVSFVYFILFILYMTESETKSPVQLDLENTVENGNQAKESNPYKHSIIAMSIVSLLAYFYANSLAPILSVLAKELHFSDIERDQLLGIQIVRYVHF